MRKNFVLPVALLASLTSTVMAQQAGADRERDAVRRVVETYLYAEEGEERKRAISPLAKILSVDASGGKIIETPISKPAKRHKGARERSRQRIVSVDVVEGAASVKVETDLSSDTLKAPTHLHYLSLMKVGGEWKIVGILMPPLRAPETVGK